jgi:tetratricopeptide (TPR) repeat protein
VLRHWRPALLLVGLVAAVVLVGLWLVPLVQSRLLVDRFVVLVAPFREEGSGQPVMSISDELARVLEEETEADIVVRQYDQIPISAAEARHIAAEHSADVLIWGEVQSGGFLNDETLRPQLVYAPVGAYAPASWVNYHGRLHLEESYWVAYNGEYVNGQAVLPPLVDALAYYTHGSPDRAYLELGLLLEDYADTLDVTLPRTLRGNVLWARGSYAEAAAAYRSLVATGSGAATLDVNYSTVLVDQAREEPSVLPQALTMLTGLDAASSDLAQAEQGTVHYNLGLLALADDDLDEAIRQLEAAYDLLPPNPELRFTLGEAYRETGQHSKAAQMLNEVGSQIEEQVAQVPEGLREPTSNYLQSIYIEQENLLRLARFVNARGRLAWELSVERRQPLPEDELDSITDNLRQAIASSSEAMLGWQRRSTINAVERNVLASQMGGALPPDMELGLTELGQQQQIEELRARQNYALALGLIEEGYTTQRTPRGILAQLWGWIVNIETPLDEARSVLADQGDAGARPLRVLVAEARALRIYSQMPDGTDEMLDRATALYAQATNQYPQRPEGWYGLGQIAKLNGDWPAAERQMQQAIDLDNSFFPAHITLLNFALEDEGKDRDWDSAIAHLRALYTEYEDFETHLALASTLREAAAAGAGDTQDRRDEAENRLEAMGYAPARSGAERARALVVLGELYIDENREDQAEEAFQQALDADNDAAIAAYEMGKLYTRQGDYTGARQEFQQAADMAQGSIWAETHLSIARLYENQLQQPEEASEHYAYLLRDDVRDVKALIEAGDGLLRHGETEAAVDVFRRAHEIQVQQGVDNAALEHRLAEAYLELDDFEAAYSHALRVLELTDDPGLRAAAYVVQGDAVRQMRRPDAFEEARAAYNAALELGIDQVEVHAELGMGQLDVGRDNWQQALSHFDQAMQMAESYSDDVDDEEEEAQYEDLVALTYFWYAEALQRQPLPNRNIPVAIQYYTRTLDLRPTLTEARLGQAHAYHTAGNSQQAVALVDQALDARPDYPEALLFQGRLLWERGLEQEALEALNRAIDIDDDLGPLFYHRGMLLIERDEFDAALDDLQRAVALEPGNSDAYYWLGRANLALDQAREALNALQEALRLDSSLLEARFYQGLAEEALNRFDEARASFETVWQQAANSELGQKAREEWERIQQSQ